ncbi:hypothetical protein JIQ42_07973 [Leishmania sp. Namibia]|uniref:hypothetical protein n=1 Tax=Leishmania sp. Namibia TaxID=2802991 RepID=UPI001B7BB172|nr:hypothetical protein JIQ42_07973 [Leishmania sp. Namibia]
MVLRHYRWLPLELEPDYNDGYTCDHCHRDFLEAPFYHEEATGTDYCLDCGNAAGYTPFSGLIASLLFSSGNEVLRDSDSNAIALFAYRVDSQSAGIFFANTDNLILRLDMSGNIRDAVYYTVKDGSIESKLRVVSTDLSRRFSWLNTGISTAFDVELHLHMVPLVPIPLDDFCVIGYYATDELIEIRLNEAYTQLLDVRRGREIVAKIEMPVCTFSAQEVDGCSKSEATRVLRDLLSEAESIKKL